MEATAVSLARTVLDGVLGSAGTAVADEAALLLGVRREVEFIRNELEMMQSFLRVSSAACPEAAGGGVCGKDTVRTWVKQVRDLAYDVEDCLLDFFMLHASRAWLPGAGLAARHRIAERIRDLKASVEELNQRNQRYHVFVADQSPPPLPAEEHLHDELPSRERPSHELPSREEWPSPDREWQVIGRAGEKDDLAKLVTQEAITVVAVWGMGGMGKSSVARMLYNDSVFLDGFDCSAWVTVPHPLDGAADELIRRRLMKQLGVEGGVSLSAWLKEKRCLVVVDDLSSREEWEHISRCLAASGSGSRVVVTTRREDVARQCAGDVYELKPLADQDARRLLYQKVYKGAEYNLPDDGMAKEANRILGRCRGLPLAIATIGGLLANRPKMRIEWMKLRQHLGSELESDQAIKRVITSSYDGLPYHLKSCFLYLSIFPENHEMRCTRLVRRWVAEGYITKPRDMTVEEVGRRYYNELVNRSMIQPSKKARASMAVERCSVHGVVLQIILSKSIEENQLFIIDKHCNEVPQSKIRHLVVTRWKRSEEKMASINLSRIRSLTVFGECPLSLISPKLRLLRVLDLEDTVGLENDDLKHIGELHHLRYLGLRGTNISRLPSSLQNLRYLETLDVQDTKVTQLPIGIANLEKLRHLVGGVNFAKDLVEKMKKKNATKCNGNFLETLADLVCRCCGDYKEERCESSCPCCAGQLSVRAPERIEKLRNLQVLGVVHIAQGSGVARYLEKLTSLRRLGVDLTVTEEAGKELCISIGRLVRLERLEMRSESLEFLKDKNASPPKHLLSLRLCGRLGSFPGWISSLSDLAKVKLLRTQLKQEDIELIGNLRNLALLGLWEESFAEESLRFGNDTFRKLRLLHIEGLEEIKTIQIEDGALPELEKLRVRKCLKLYNGEEGLSSVLSLRNLNELGLTSCGDKLQLEKSLQRQISGFEKRPKLLIGRSIVTRSPSFSHYLGDGAPPAT